MKMEEIRPRPISRQRTTFGQGKRVTTLLTEDGCHVPVISHAPYIERRYLQTTPFPGPRSRTGQPTMQKTTFMLGDGGRSKTQFITTTNQVFGGSKSLNPARRPKASRSMHISQLDQVLANKYGDGLGSGDWNTGYKNTYHEKDIIPANRLHLTSFSNKINQNKGTDMQDVVRPTTSVATYWSQYGRIHNKLGAILGPGVPRGYPIRQQYDVLTGECKGAACKEENARISGNRILHGCRKGLLAPIIS